MCGSVCGTTCPDLQKEGPAHLPVAGVLCPAEVWGVHPETTGWAGLRVTGEGWQQERSPLLPAAVLASWPRTGGVTGSVLSAFRALASQ